MHLPAAALGIKRSRAQGPLLVAVAMLCLLVAGTTGAISGYLQVRTAEGIQSTLHRTGPTAAAAQLQTGQSSDPQAQQAAARTLFQDLLGPTAVKPEVRIQTVPQDLTIEGGQADLDQAVLLSGGPPVRSRARLVDGAWPSGGTGTQTDPIEAVLQADAAGSADLAIGDLVTVGNDEPRSTLRLVGLWRAIDPSDPYWMRDRLVAGGVDGPVVGPFLIDPAAVAELTTRPRVNWVLLPADGIAAEQIPGLIAGLDGLADAARAEPAISVGGIIFDPSGLGATLAAIAQASAAVGGVSPLPFLAVAMVGVFAMVQLSRLLAGVRERETGLLRARGATVRRSVVRAGAEGLLVSGVGSVAGLVLADVLIRAVATGDPSLNWWLAALTTAVMTSTLMVSTALSARHRGTPVGGESGRVARAGAGTSIVLIFIAAGVSLWQFRLYGGADPVAVLAPVLALAALCLLVLLVVALVGAAADRAAHRMKGAALALPVRQVARRVPVFGVCVLLVALVTGVGTVASTYAETWDRASTANNDLAAGADVRVSVPSVALGGQPLAATDIAGLAGVRAGSPAMVRDVAVLDDSLELVGLPAAQIPRVMTTAGGSVDTARISSAVSGGTAAAGPQLPAGATDVRLDLSTYYVGQPAATVTARLVLWLLDADGSVAAVDLPGLTVGTVGTPAQQSVSFAVPRTASAWQVAAADVVIEGVGTAQTYGLQVDTMVAEVDGTQVPVDLSEAELTAVRGVYDADPDEATTTSGGFGVTVGTGLRPSATQVRLVPGSGEQTKPVPVVIDRLTSQRLGVEVGDSMSMKADGVAIEAIVSDQVPLVPGGTAVVVADLPSLYQFLLRTTTVINAPSELWLSSSSPLATAAALRSAFPDNAVVTTADDLVGALTEPVRTALLIGAAGCVLLALVALAAVTASMARGRRPEVAVLRSLGWTAAQQVRGRVVELAGTVVISMVFGALAGWLVSWLTVSRLARSAVVDAPAALPVDLRLDPLSSLSLIAAIVVATLVVLGCYGIVVRRQARDRLYREETR